MPFMMTTAVQQRVSEIQQALRDAEIDGWLSMISAGVTPSPIAYFSSILPSM
jgi:hypothetical protein